jgi:hypothetical protein
MPAISFAPSRGGMFAAFCVLALVAFCNVSASPSQIHADITQSELKEPWQQTIRVPARETKGQYPGCNTNTESVRNVVDNFFTANQADELLAMMKTALKSSPEVS